MRKDKKEPLAYPLADWFLKSGGKIVPHKEIASEIEKLHKERGGKSPEIGYGYFSSIICQVRARLETAHHLTLHCVKGIGYKLATPQEYAFYTMWWVKRTYHAADRTQRLFPGVDRKLIPEAMKKVFGNSQNKLMDLAHGAQKFILGFNQMRKEQKQIEHKVG